MSNDNRTNIWTIEARAYPINIPVTFGMITHNYFTLVSPEGEVVKELHGLAVDTNTGESVAVGDLNNLLQAVLLTPNQNLFHAFLNTPGQTIKSCISGNEEEVLNRWNCAEQAIEAINSLGVHYPSMVEQPFGLSRNSNSVFNTFGKIMGFEVIDYPNTIAPGILRIMSQDIIDTYRYQNGTKSSMDDGNLSVNNFLLAFGEASSIGTIVSMNSDNVSENKYSLNQYNLNTPELISQQQSNWLFNFFLPSEKQFDDLYRMELQKKLSYLDIALKRAELIAAERVGLERDEVAAAQKGRDRDARNYGKTAQEDQRGINETSSDYEEMQIKEMNNSPQNNLAILRTGTQLVNNDFKDIFQDMNIEVDNLLSKMSYNKFAFGPLWDNVAEERHDSSSGKVDEQFVQEFVVGSDYFYQNNSPDNLNTYAMDGAVLENKANLFDKEVLPMDVSNNSGNINRNQRVDQVSASTKQASSVIVNIHNETGTKARAHHEVQWDGKQYLINVVLDA